MPEATPPLLPHDERDKLEERLQHAVSGFIDAPRTSVEEVDKVVEEITGRISDALTQRRRTLRRSWQSTEASTPSAEASTETSAPDTEQLRLALRDYRELADRLLRV
ncbi:hypothetical protein [Streptomyces sp. GESEQ-35]|uniref:hypothetical protein n=1 Tax=Streptomyces sp. GESEQ-35 TaxID=2812657 RepID=UPI001B33EF48